MFTAKIIAPDLRIWPSVLYRARKQAAHHATDRLLTRAVLAPIPDRQSPIANPRWVDEDPQAVW